MAKLLDVIRDEDSSETKERLQLLLTAAEAKLALFKNDLRTRMEDDIYQVGSKILMERSGVRVDVSSSVTGAIDGITSALLFNSPENVKSSVKTFVTDAMGSIFGVSQAGQLEDLALLPITENDVPMTLHIFVWKYQFSSTGVIGKTDNAYAYLAAKTGLRPELVTKSRIEELVIGESDESKKLVDQVVKAAKKSKKMPLSSLENKLNLLLQDIE